jgi:hypothetical protein
MYPRITKRRNRDRGSASELLRRRLVGARRRHQPVVQIIDTGDPRANFVPICSAPSSWEALIARDAAGAELETYRRR